MVYPGIHIRPVSSTRILFSVVLLEYLLIIFSGVGFTSLHADPFFYLEVDPAAGLAFGLYIPQTIVGHQWLAVLMDVSIVLSLLLLIKKPENNRLALLVFILLFIFYITLTAYLTHRNYQAGFFLLFFPFIFAKSKNKIIAFEAIRYFLLFFYFSAACLKVFSGSLYNAAHFSNLLTTQFTPYFLEENTGVRTMLNLYLVEHTVLAQVLYAGGFLIEISVAVGFFTKRFDKSLAILILIFHLLNWLIMDIAPVGQVGFISLLFLSRRYNIHSLSK